MSHYNKTMYVNLLFSNTAFYGIGSRQVEVKVEQHFTKFI